MDASQVVVWGPGVEPGKVRAGVPLTFHVDGTKAGRAPLEVDISTEKGKEEGGKEGRGERVIDRRKKEGGKEKL